MPCSMDLTGKENKMLGYILGTFFGIAIWFGVIALESWIFMLLWNWSIASIFATIPELTFWQAVILLGLVNFIVGFVQGLRRKDKNQ